MEDEKTKSPIIKEEDGEPIIKEESNENGARRSQDFLRPPGNVSINDQTIHITGNETINMFTAVIDRSFQKFERQIRHHFNGDVELLWDAHEVLEKKVKVLKKRSRKDKQSHRRARKSQKEAEQEAERARKEADQMK